MGAHTDESRPGKGRAHVNVVKKIPVASGVNAIKLSDYLTALHVPETSRGKRMLSREPYLGTAGRHAVATRAFLMVIGTRGKRAATISHPPD